MKKKRSRHKITFQDEADIELVALAELGRSNESIRLNTGRKYTDGQIHYRLTKAKNLAGLSKGEGFRKQWRDGTSDVAQGVARALVPGLRKEIKRDITSQLIHQQGSEAPAQ